MNTPSTTIMTRGQGLRRSTKLWLSWILAGAVGYSLGIAIPGGCLYVLLIMLQGGMWYDASVIEVWAIYLAFLVPASVIGGWVVGGLQGLVLRGRLERPRTWVLCTALAWTSVVLVPMILLYFLSSSESEIDTLPLLVLSGLVIGAIVGTGQWAALRWTVKAAGWWIPVSPIAWVLGILTGNFLRSLALPGTEISMIVAVVGGEIVISMVTGLALVVLLEPNRQGWLNAAILTGLSAVLALGVPLSLINGFSQQSKILHTGYFVEDLAFSADGTRLAALGFTNTEGEGDWLSVWDAPTWKLVGKMEADGGLERRMDLSPDGKLAVTGGGEAWDVSSSEELWSAGVANDVVFSPDGERVAMAYGKSESGWIEIRDAATGSRQLEIRGEGQLYIYRLAFSPDGRTLASGSGPNSDFTVRVWDAETGRYLQGFPGLHPEVEAMAFLPDRQVLIAGGGNGYHGEDAQTSLRMWDLRTGGEVTSVDLTDTVKDLAISRDGKWLAVVFGYPDYDPKIYLYDLATGDLVRVLKGHTDKVTSLQFSPDGRYLATGSYDETVRLWEIDAQTPTRR